MQPVAVCEILDTPLNVKNILITYSFEFLIIMLILHDHKSYFNPFYREQSFNFATPVPDTIYESEIPAANTSSAYILVKTGEGKKYQKLLGLQTQMHWERLIKTSKDKTVAPLVYLITGDYFFKEQN